MPPVLTLRFAYMRQEDIYQQRYEARRAMAISGGLSVALLALAVALSSKWLTNLAGAWLLVDGGLWVLGPRIAWWRNRRNGPAPEYTCEIGDSGFTTFCDGNTVDVGWSEVKFVRRTDRLYLVRLDEGFFTLPRRAFESAGKEAAFSTLVQQQTGEPVIGVPLPAPPR